MGTRQFQIDELTLILNEYFQWSKPRMACFFGMLVAIMIANTVNLTQLVLFFPSRALILSHYRRIQRFFHHHRLDYNEVARFVMKLFGFMDIDSLLSLAFKTMKSLIIHKLYIFLNFNFCQYSSIPN